MSLPIDPTMVVTIDALPSYRIVKSFGTSEGVSASFFPGRAFVFESSLVFGVMREAFLDMCTRAAAQGANAIVGLRYTVSGEDEPIVIAYGTAVKVERS